MKALIYLTLTQLKNRILALRKKPALLILYGFAFTLIIFSIIVVIVSQNKLLIQSYQDSRYIYLFLCGFGLLYLVSFINAGLSIGSTFFTMADVGLLFVAPVSNKKILFYGLVTSIGKTVIASIFIFYQIPNLKRVFGYGFAQIAALFFIYVVLILFCQLVSIAVYIFSNQNQLRKNLVRYFLYGFLAFILLAVFFIAKRENLNVVDAGRLLVDSNWFGYLPIIGWMIMFFKGVITSAIIKVIIALALFLATGIILMSLLTANEADFYEDVLHSTELTYQRLKDYKEGRNISLTTNRKVKVKDNESGIRGKGAYVFASKHFIEMKRSTLFIFVDSLTLFLTIGAAIAGYAMKKQLGFSYSILAFVIYIQYFSTVFGRIKIELMKPYIYLIPDSSIKKVFAASISSLIKPCIDSIVIFGVLALIGGAGILECVFMALAYSSSGALFVALTLVYQRLLGGQPNRVGRVLIGLLLMLIIISPAVIVSVLVTLFILSDSLSFLATLPYSIICLIFAFSMFIACGSILDKTEISDSI